MRWVGLVLVAGLVAAGCTMRTVERPVLETVAFERVELPGGAMPVTLTSDGDSLLVGTWREGRPTVPGLVRLDGTGAREIPVTGASPYGQLARWRSVSVAGDRIIGLGGERGGAHGHVRWSVWSGSDAGLTEQVQGFSVFGGYEAGDLVGMVATPDGDLVVGAWAGAQSGFDVAVWTTDGVDWRRQPSAGTALESTKESLGFPMAAAGHGDGVVVAGWRVALGGKDSGQEPVVWQSERGFRGWTRSTLPDAGAAGSAVAVRCDGKECGVAGRVDGKLAVWRLDDAGWRRLAGEPPIAVDDREPLVAPVMVAGRLIQPIDDGGPVELAEHDGGAWTVHTTGGPEGTVTAAAAVGTALYVLAGPSEDEQVLWRGRFSPG